MLCLTAWFDSGPCHHAHGVIPRAKVLLLSRYQTEVFLAVTGFRGASSLEKRGMLQMGSFWYHFSA